MKVEIENTPMYTLGNPEPLIVLNGIIRLALKSKTLKELETELKTNDTYGYIFGFGGNHCWVKQPNISERILFITERR